jgi:UDP-N-acetylmuramoyl-L-alanyl-D-glutamate--2,6-diaminopimelate ligase
MSDDMPISLAHLLAGAGASVSSGDPNVPISSISVDSRRVEPGSLFICLRGGRADGHDHATAAVSAGASAVLAQRPLNVGPNVAVAVVDDTLAALSKIAANFYGDPSRSLIVAGVTGTNGKTTTTHFIEAIAGAAGTPFGLVGTLGARLHGRFEDDVENTTPFAHELQGLLARFRDEGAKGAVIEVSSHALALHRVDDVAFDVAVFTNLTQDHLDFHVTLDDYRSAKRRLFAMTAHGSKAGTAVLNADDPESAAIAKIAGRVLTYGIRQSAATLVAADIKEDVASTTFLVKAIRPVPFEIRLRGMHNVANAMAAIGAATVLDFDVEAIADGLAAVTDVPGRMTRIDDGEITVYVDYAHTPDGLRKALEAARSPRGRLICVFGCGGDRDRQKRPLMGAIARSLCDLTIVTSDNPRFEDPASIVADIVGGMGEPGGVFEVELDRAKAIERAVTQARQGDVVVVAGKGHETYQLVRAQRLPFSDFAAVRSALERDRAC